MPEDEGDDSALSKVFVEHCDLQHEAILEIGCGSSHEMSRILSKIYDRPVAAIDIDPGMLTRAKHAKGFECVDYLAMNACNLMFKNQSFDTIVLFNALHFITSIEKFFTEARRVLTPSGKIIVISKDMPKLAIPDDSSFSSSSAETVDDMLNEALGLLVEVFHQELVEHWSLEISDNHRRYCDPSQANLSKILCGLVRLDDIMSDRLLPILELQETISKWRVAQKYINKNGWDAFEEHFSRFLSDVALILGIAEKDLYFEDIPLIMKSRFCVQIHSKI